MLKFAAEFSAPLLSQLDPKVVYDAKQELRSASSYAHELLNETCGARAASIASSLVENFPTHGFVISYQAASRLGLPVRPIDAYDLLEVARRVHRQSEDGRSTIRFCPLAEFMDEIGGARNGKDEKKNASARPPASGRRSRDVPKASEE
jgi:hypothetical protein